MASSSRWLFRVRCERFVQYANLRDSCRVSRPEDRHWSNCRRLRKQLGQPGPHLCLPYPCSRPTSRLLNELNLNEMNEELIPIFILFRSHLQIFWALSAPCLKVLLFSISYGNAPGNSYHTTRRSLTFSDTSASYYVVTRPFALHPRFAL